MGKKGRPPIKDKIDNIYRLRINDSKSEIISELIYYTMDIYRKKFSHYNRKELKGYDEN